MKSMLSGRTLTSLKEVNLQPFDLVLFRSPKFNPCPFEYGHCGIILTNKLLPSLEEGKVYLWESTKHNFPGNNVKNIKGNYFVGSQVRLFSEVVSRYLQEPNDIMAIYHAKWPLPTVDKFKPIFEKYNGRFYIDKNILSQLQVYWSPKVKKWMSSIEMTVKVYQKLGILNPLLDYKKIQIEDLLDLLQLDKPLYVNS